MSFRSNELRECYRDANKATRNWGPELGRRYVQRVALLMDLPTWRDVQAVASLRAHRLHVPYEGQWALDLNRRARLHVTTNEQTEVTVEEVTQHYGD